MQGAWEAAQAGWVRAPLAPGGPASLRGQLEELIQIAIVPERARILGRPAEVLREEWATFKQRWSNP